MLILALCLLAAPARAAPAPAQAAAPTPALAPPITTDVWREPAVPLDLHWQLLAWPERVVELAFTPLAVLVTVVERYRLDRRFYDLIRNDAGTIVLTPQVKLSFGDGMGSGATLALKNCLGLDERVKLEALTRLNRDYEVGANYRQRLAWLDGRELTFAVAYEVDRNLRYYGLGNDTTADDERVVRSDALTAESFLDLNGRGIMDLTSRIALGFRRERLSSGQDSTIPGVGEPGDSVVPPPGFGAGQEFAALRVMAAYDTRDTLGRPTRGVHIAIEVAAEKQIDGASSALSGHASAWWYLPLLPDRRVLALGAGIDAVTPLLTNDEVPFHDLVTLGRKHHLRGYHKDRFRDREGWWTSAEYRFPVYEYLSTGVALEPSLFFDLGRVGSQLADLADEKLHASYGVGLRAAHETVLIFQLELGRSTEGFQFGFAAGGNL